jgi:hypothetical protein
MQIPALTNIIDSMTRLAGDRLAAWVVDWLCILVWVALTASVGVPLFLSGITRGVSTVWLNVTGALVLIVPVTVGLAWLESGTRQSTVGKRTRRLQLVGADTGSRVTFSRALLRNSLKIALPWTLGHAVVFGIVQTGSSGSVPGWLWTATAAAYVLPIVYVTSLFLGRGRTPYDRLSRTAVIK